MRGGADSKEVKRWLKFLSLLIILLTFGTVVLIYFKEIKISSMFFYKEDFKGLSSKAITQFTTEDLKQETIKKIKNASEEGLPLAGAWNTNTFDPNWQVDTLIPLGHVIMPWFGFYVDNRSWDSIKSRYEKPILLAAENKLPISFMHNQFEVQMISKGWCSRPVETNPCYQKLDGTFTNELGVLSSVEAWYEIGYEMGSQGWLKKIQEIYPDPPLVILLDNHEPSLNDDLLNNKQYMDKYGNDPRYNDPVFMDQIKKEAWKERYDARFRGFRDALISENWKRNLKDVPYTGYFRAVSTVVGRAEQGWGGICASSYTLRYMGDRDYLVMGPQVEAGNLRFGCEESKRSLDPNFHCEVLTAYGEQTATQGLEIIGQTFTPERYRGTTQFVLWASKVNVLREWRGSTTPRDGVYGLFFNILLNSVDRVYYNPILRKFWKEGKIVPNKKTNCLTEQQYINNDTFFVLDADVNGEINWGNCGAEVKVYSLAYVIGEVPERQWLLYTHAPLGTIENVSIIIPDYKEVKVPKSEQGGSFYIVDEKTDSVQALNSFNFLHNHPPVAVDESYESGVGEILNITNRWVSSGKPLWFNDKDLDGDPMEYILVEGPSHGKVTFNFDGTFIYLPEENFVGTDSFSYKIFDGMNYSNTASVKIKVSDFYKIIDDGDEGYEEESHWNYGNVTGSYVGYGINYKYHTAGGTAGLEPISRASWVLNSLASDDYEVYTTWSPSWSRTTSAPYSIFDGDKKIATVKINQGNAPSGVTIGDTPWQKLGSYKIESGKLKVEVTSEASWTTVGKTVVVADAIRVVRPSTGQEWIVDNEDSDYSETSSWVPSLAKSYNGDVRHVISAELKKDHEQKAKWNFENLPEGFYEVFVTWPASSLNNHGAVNYYLTRDNETFTKQISQKSTPSTLFSKGVWWESFGEYYVKNKKIKVELTNYAKGAGRIMSDAVGLIKRSNKFLIIDDGDEGFVENGCRAEVSWGYRGDSRYENGNNCKVTRVLYNLIPGSYRIYMTNWITGWPANMSFVVKDDSKEILSTVLDPQINVFVADKNFDGASFQDMGTYNIEGNKLSVEVTLIGNGKIRIDALLLEFLDEVKCVDNDKDGFGKCPNCNNLAECEFNGNDCNDENPFVNPLNREGWNIKSKWENCKDNIDNDCNNLVDCKDVRCLNSPNCAGRIDISLVKLPRCIKVLNVNDEILFLKNHSVCDDGILCTEDFCTIEGCKYRVLSEKKSCWDLMKNCKDSDTDGVLDYNSTNCTIGKDFCIEDVSKISLDSVNPISLRLNVSFNRSSRDIRNVEGLQVSRPNIGRIKFKDKVDLFALNESGCFSQINLDLFLLINERKVILNTSEFYGLNKSARIEFYNIDYSNPTILKDGKVCSECNLLNFDKDNGIVEAEVPSFSTYEIVEYDCGNGVCESNEDCTSCYYDCGECPIVTDSGSSTDSSGGESTPVRKRNISSKANETASKSPTEKGNETKEVPLSESSKKEVLPFKNKEFFYYSIVSLVITLILGIFVIIIIRYLKRKTYLDGLRNKAIESCY